ncbi:Serine/threonine-protein kinase WNK-related, partial [Thalictrum thalictroides]
TAIAEVMKRFHNHEGASIRWDMQGGAFDRSRGNRRNWILVWEDGFCNFAASTKVESGDCIAGSSLYGNNEFQQLKGLQPELFFKICCIRPEQVYEFNSIDVVDFFVAVVLAIYV